MPREQTPADARLVATEIAEGAPTRTVHRTEVAGNEKILDIGPESRERFSDMIERSKSVLE